MIALAGRIWYIGRQAQIVTGQRFRQRYDTAVAIMYVNSAVPLNTYFMAHSRRLESGLLYCLCAIIYVISASLNSGSASVSHIKRNAH
jgi:hypothetical protein